MNRAAKRRHIIRWARYFNRYSHISDVTIGGSSARDAVLSAWLGTKRNYFLHVRRQAKHRVGGAS